MTAQAVSADEPCRSFGSSGTIGITRVCISETTMPPKASTATRAFDLGTADVPAPAGRAGASGMAGASVGVQMCLTQATYPP
ncbi:hypothetical protein GCM10022206_19190 [Streptomyces chiangmaiensis]